MCRQACLCCPWNARTQLVELGSQGDPWQSEMIWIALNSCVFCVCEVSVVTGVHRYPWGDCTQGFSASERPSSNFFTSCSGSLLVMAPKDHFSPWRSMKQNWKQHWNILKQISGFMWLNISCRYSLPRSLLIFKGINDAFVATRLKSFELPVFRFVFLLKSQPTHRQDCPISTVHITMLPHVAAYKVGRLTVTHIWLSHWDRRANRPM